MRLISVFMLSFLFTSFCTKPKVLVCYGKFEIDKVSGYDLVVLESKFFTFYEIQELKKTNKKVVAYISLGEVNESSPDYHFLKENTIGKNFDWNSHYLDLKIESTKVFLEKKIENILFMGFDGLFLDNIDNFCSFGIQKSQFSEVVSLIESIKTKYPNCYLVQNAGLELVNRTHRFIDYILIESVITNFEFKDRIYKLREEQAAKEYLEEIDSIHSVYSIPIVLLEYCDNKKLKKTIKSKAKKTKYAYYISDISLQKLPE